MNRMSQPPTSMTSKLTCIYVNSPSKEEIITELTKRSITLDRKRSAVRAVFDVRDAVVAALSLVSSGSVDDFLRVIPRSSSAIKSFRRNNVQPSSTI